MLVASVFVITPGILLYPILRAKNFNRTESLGLGLVGLVWLFSTVGTFFGYHFGLFVGLYLAVIAVLVWLGDIRQLRSLWTPNWERWQWLLVASIVVAYVGLAYIPFVPWDTDAQGFSWLIVTVQQSGSINTLAPFHPEIGWFYSPSFFIIGALLSDLTGAVAPDTALGLGHILGIGLVFSIAGVGRLLLGDRGYWWTLALAASSIALLTSLMDSAYTTMHGLWVTCVFLMMLSKAVSSQPSAISSADSQPLLRITPYAFAAGLALSGVLLAHGDAIIQLLIVYLPFYVVVFLAKPRFSKDQYLLLIIVIPVLGVLLSAPWLLVNFDLILNIDVHERQSPVNWFAQAIWYLNGVWLLAVGILGALYATYKRHWLGLWCALWLLATYEFGIWGNIDKLSKATAFDPLSVGYPYGITWHAPIIPLPILAALILVPFGDWLAPKVRWEQRRTGVMWLALATTVVGLIATPPIIRQLTQRLNGGPVMSIASPADLDAYSWIKHNTAPDALLLNYPDHFEGQWAPVYAERQAIYEREQLFFIGASKLFARWDLMETAYHDPVNPQSENLIRLTGVDYIVVPQWQGNPESFKRDYQRLRLPANTEQLSWFGDADYLELVADFDGAQIYKVVIDQ